MKIVISLAALDSTDVDTCRKWRNRYEIWRWCRQSDFISDVEQADWFARQSADKSIKMYKILCDGAMVGVCGLTSIDWINRRAEFSLYTDPDKHGHGYGKEALKILLIHAFTNLNLNLIWCESFDGNPAIKMFHEICFKFDGTRRQFYFKDGKYIDAHIASLTAEEWRNHGKPCDNPRVAGPDEPTAESLDTPDVRKRGKAAKPKLKVAEKSETETASN